MKKTCVIFNPCSGKGLAVQEAIQASAQSHACEFYPTDSDCSAAVQARSALEDGVERIIVAGGDGTLSQVVNGLAPDFASVEVGLLPVGTGNDFARSLGLPADNLEAAIRIAFGDGIRSVDLIRVIADHISYAINAVTGGMGGRVAADVNPADKARWGAIAYWMTALSELVDMQTFQLQLDLDGQRFDQEIYGVVVANGRSVGGGFPIAPTARIDDGMLDVTVIPVLPTVELLASGLNYALGRINNTDQVKTYQARRIRIAAVPELYFSIDGEPTRKIEATFEVVPRALRMVVDPSSVESP